MGYQKGDGRIVLGGQVFGLRLTMGALAEISQKLTILGPADLADCLRNMSQEHCQILLSSLTRAYGQAAPRELGEADMAAALPEIAAYLRRRFVTPPPNWPFEAWLKIAVMQLGLSPRDFWSLSLSDWFLLTRPARNIGLSRKALLKMEQDYEHK